MTLKKEGGVHVEALIKSTDTECFIINRITLDGGECELNAGDSYGVYIVTNGSGEIKGDGYSHTLKKGDYFFMPACLAGKYTVFGSLEMIECM